MGNVRVFDTNEYDRAYVALVTPFKENSLDIDEDKYREFVRRYTQDSMFNKARGAIIANPEASETFYMSQEERDLLTKIAVEETAGKFPVFVGAYGSSVPQYVDAAVHAKKLGADGIFAFPPAGSIEVSMGIDTEWNPEIWTEHIRTIALATDLPIILHPAAPFSQNWGAGLSAETIRMVLTEVPSVVGYKMIFHGNSEAAWYKAAQAIRSIGRHVSILETTHIEPFTFQAEMLARSGGLVDGLVQGAFTFVKEPLTEFIVSINENDLKNAEKVWTQQVQPVYNVIYGLGGFSRMHIHYKIAAWIRGFVPHPFMRPPMPLPRMPEIRLIYKVLERTGLSHISESEMEQTFSKGKDIPKNYIDSIINESKSVVVAR